MTDLDTLRIHVRQSLEDVPSPCRLRVINDLLVAEIEQFGYDIAPQMRSDIVNAVFILAVDTGARLSQVQALIAREIECTDRCPYGGTCKAA